MEKKLKFLLVATVLATLTTFASPYGKEPHGKAFQNKTNSQFTKTCFSDGHIEAVVFYTDGTHYTYPTEWLDGNQQRHRLPHAGDWKHIEWVWRLVNNQWQWVETVHQNY